MLDFQVLEGGPEQAQELELPTPVDHPHLDGSLQFLNLIPGEV